jgi:hypothetical protein
VENEINKKLGERFIHALHCAQDMAMVEREQSLVARSTVHNDSFIYLINIDICYY